MQNTQAFWTILFGFCINKEEFLKIELVGIVACFCGVLLMAQADVDPENQLAGHVTQAARILGFVLMCVCAANDGMVAVLARQMKDLHFSVMMCWFSTIGLVLTVATIVITSLHA